MRRRAFALLAGVALASAGAAPARAEVDLAPLVAQIDASLAGPALPRKARSVCTALRRKLVAADRPGLGDDFAKLLAVARALRGPLRDDTVLADALAVAIADGFQLTAVAVNGLAVATYDLEAPKDRQPCDALGHRAQGALAAARFADVQGRTDRACTKGRAAAAALARGGKVLAKALSRQAARAGGLRGAFVPTVHAIDVARSGTSPVYAVGPHDDDGPKLYRGANSGFVRIPLAGTDDLLGVHAVDGGSVWAVGTNGRVVVYDPATGAVTERPVIEHGGELRDVWAAADDDVWVCGDDPDGAGPLPAIFHWDGEAWSPATVAAPAGVPSAPLNDLWGSAQDDVWACGTLAVLHSTGFTWSIESGLAAADWKRIGGSDPVAVLGVGGSGPVVFERPRFGTWAAAEFPSDHVVPTVGVHVTTAGETLLVGPDVFRRATAGWKSIETGAFPGATATALAPNGDFWVVRGGVDYLGPLAITAAVPLPQTSLAARVHAIFTRDDSCAQAACHAPPFLSEGLDLATPEGLRARLAGVASRQSLLPLVAPGRPAASYLFRKIEGTHGFPVGSGDVMPQGEAPLTQEEIDAVRAWILEGALDN